MNRKLRNRIGLKEMLKSWKVFKIKNLITNFYISENNVIEKAIYRNEMDKVYWESDLNIQLNHEGKMVTKTGKVKNLSSSVYHNLKKKGIILEIENNTIKLINGNNQRALINEYDLDFNSLSEAFKFIDEYTNDKRPYFVNQLDKFIRSKKTSRIKIKSGDVFKIQVKDKGSSRHLVELSKFD